MRSILRLIRSTATHPLNSKSGSNKRAGFSRVLRWQLASRLLPEAAIALPFVRGTSLVMNRGMVGATGNWYGGLDEPGEMGLLLHLLRPGDVFVDVGANVGSFTILAASTGDVSCVAFEPLSHTFAFLKRNVAFNGMGDRVELRQQGVSDAPGKLRFTTSLDSMNYVVTSGSGETDGTIEVEVVTLDDAALPHPQGRTILKIDVEGFEMSVLKGAARTLNSPETLCVIMETNGSGKRYGVSDEELVELMSGYGFHPYGYCPFQRNFTSAIGPREHINTVFVKDIDEASRRAVQAPTIPLINGSI